MAVIAARKEIVALVAASTGLLLLRLAASATVGFGDSEALYAAYALHPQPAYLDHPGLIGIVAREIGAGTAPTPRQAHAVTALLATAWPPAMAWTCRVCGAPWKRALAAGVVSALVPEIGVGLFALTPDLPLSFAWILSIAAAASALRAEPRSPAAAFGFAIAGLMAGIACASKVSGALLLLALGATYLLPQCRAHSRSFAPWAGLAAGAVSAVPVVVFEAASGWPMLRHRLVDIQIGSALSLRNLGATVGGQLAYLSPLVAVLAGLAAIAAWRARHDPVGALLLATFAIPLGALLPLSLWSRAAEPHWLAPALLALVPAAARDPAATPRRLVVASTALSGAIVLFIHAWVLIPNISNLTPTSSDARLDISNELYGWPEVIRAVRAEVAARRESGAPDDRIAIVGPHWVLCAQLEAALRGETLVGCDTPVRDDFDDWVPRHRWNEADGVLWVTDTRFGSAPDPPGRIPLRSRQVLIRRGNRIVRVFTLTWLERRALAGAG
jgi:hypothetical protein